ncbi:haloacid dehalogenase type II [Hymenobacter sp. GOD-10R]|uniref:haloacid dehalogenase type II n=1 Tax=Hymenobacter sp. GOD-10R TaxID=3093922 RepID=UPI002D7791B7|nr:haloacid dehalogenase type II [Hymenobacter sp. GOD-10R]WRQ28755.1 haloacid dehalogenase type II [Hymenobacter sp. GOD-10R]
MPTSLSLTPHFAPVTRSAKVIFLDVNGTLLDMSKVKKAVIKAFGNKQAFDQWFLLLLQHSLVDTVTTNYHPFNIIGEAALDMTAAMLEEKPLKLSKKQEIIALMQQLDAYPDVPAGLEHLLQAGYRLIALTNSPKSVLDQQLQHAGIIGYFEQGLSIDSIQRYKPHPETYHTAARQVGVAPEEAIMIAAHGWDVAGALCAGLKAGFVARPNQTLYPLAPAPTYTGKTLLEVAQQIAY